MFRLHTATLLLVVCIPPVLADGPADNIPDNVRRIPKAGVDVPAADAEALRAELASLEQLLQKLREPLKNPQENVRRQDLLPDVEVYYKAAHDALAYNEFFDAREIPVAKSLVATGRERAEQLLKGEAPWATRTGLVVRGYRSKIDQSVQPYGLIVPASYDSQGSQGFRLDVWFHGRGETLSELSFIQQRQTQVGAIAPRDGFVLHPYGRYCNANKFAGEIDTLECLESVRKRYRIDDDRTSVRGFSMGGAACWQFAVHYADRWCAAAPGAGFSETPDFLKVFQKEDLSPPWYEKKLWRWYDCTDWAINLAHCPTVAYSGELDSQKQAADIMEAALAKENIPLVHIIGPGTKHSYHPESAVEIERRITSIVEKGRDRAPQTVQFQTYTLRYNRMAWVTVDGLAEHWEPGRITATYRAARNLIQAKSSGITDLTLRFEPGWCPFEVQRGVAIEIDEQQLTSAGPASDRSWETQLHRAEGRWVLGARPSNKDVVRKAHGLQGPIDDAFMDPFVFVKPSSAGAHEKIDKWTTAECDRAIEHWRRHYRGAAQVKLDTEVNDEDIASANLVLWGDAASNAAIRRIAEHMPIRWDNENIRVGGTEFASANHALIAIFPNPLNPKRYVVLNSSFTFRDYDYLNNARQTPKLPDWAIVDVDTPPNSRYPGKVVAAEFFDEEWKLKPLRK